MQITVCKKNMIYRAADSIEGAMVSIADKYSAIKDIVKGSKNHG